ncbi:hypothetical protein G6N76_00675 [Rhizobium daejeonense]|uniref:Alkaline proteinase inhibitor/ Outer membrane lipoprotein Omp19 domain-containing protein n=1 Tax=Rhizobium daejeonense TaxID=240521 RepID=A0A6M1RZF5_9HYPH|nr:hypothetical protein [Rhizobium daejeonense]NGO62170.1 hypothetical protein [Rhizobium daejeonense]
MFADEYAISGWGRRVKAYIIVLTGGFLIAGVAVAGVYGWRQADASGAAFDPVVSGSIRVNANGSIIAPPAEFSISNTVTKTTCIAERGGTLQSRNRSFSAPRECDDVWPKLSSIRSWAQEEDGSVTLANGAGQPVLTLTRKKGLVYETVRPAGAGIALQMLPE